MSLLFKSTRTNQPQGTAAVDWANPLAKGLVAGFDAANPTRDVSSNAPITSTRAKSIGPAGRNISGSSGFVSIPTSAKLEATTSYFHSRSVFFLLSTTTTGNTVIAEKGVNTNFVCQTLFSKFSWRIEGRGLDAISTTSNITSGLPVAVAGTASSSGIQKVFFGGNKENTNTGTGGISNSSPIVIGARDGDLYAMPGDIYLALFWDRELSEVEVKSISSDPWQLFAPQSRTLWLPGTVAAGGTALTLPSLANSSTIYSGVISIGSHSLATPLIASNDLLYAGGINQQPVTLSAPIVPVVGALMYAGSVAKQPVAISIPSAAASAALYSPALGISTGISIPFLGSAAAVYNGSVVKQPVVVSNTAISSTAQLFSGTLLTNTTVAAPAIGSSEQLFASGITVGSVAIALTAISSTSVLSPASVLNKGAAVAPPVIASNSQLFTASVVKQSVAVSLNAITATSQAFTPSVSVKVALPALVASSQYFASNITIGVIATSAPFISSVSSVSAPTIGIIDLPMALPTLASTQQTFDSLIAIGAIQVGLAVLPSELAFYPMVVVGGDVYVPPPVMVSRVSFDTAQQVIFNTSASTGVFANGTADFVSFDVKN